MSRPKRPRDDEQQNVFTSPPIIDRGSTFIAAFSFERNHKELQALSDFKDATHRMAAWRVPSSQQTLTAGRPTLKRGHDDDGESRGGTTLAQTLDAMNVEGSVVVARWWGGVMLGPVRFAHIEACARRAIIAAQEIQRTETLPKKPKVSEEEQQAQQDRLIDVIERRDGSIAVLRELLAEKKHAKSVSSSQDQTTAAHSGGVDNSRSPSSSQQQQGGQPSKYAGQSVEALRRVEAARDRTISFLLGAIDKAEAEAASNASNSDNPTGTQEKDGQHDSNHEISGEEDKIKTRANEEGHDKTTNQTRHGGEDKTKDED